MQNKYFLIFFIVLIPFGTWAQDKTPKYSNEFLSIGVGARGLAMSNSLTAVVDDVTAGYWNPAGLLEVKNDYEFSLMHAEYFAGIAKYDYAGFAAPIDSMSTLGVSVIRFGVDDIPDTRFLYDASGAINYDRIRFFSAADYAFLLSYARKMSFLPGLKMGANFKVVHRVAGNFASAWGFGLDLGAQLDVKRWKFGLMVRDITGTFNAWSHNTELVIDVYTQTGNEIPENSVEITVPKAILGVGRYIPIKSNFGVLASADLTFSFDGKRNVLLKSDFASFDASMGVELNYKQLAFVRFGAGKVEEIKDFDESTYMTFQPNFGVGFKLKSVNIDYALTDIGDQSESLYSHVFSIKAALDKK
ncbi:PorV/PorQ family protein [Fulvivirga sp. RKSG066]|uniref:putative type IX sorting system protein PorV2 n=1 Tax=Fulvivirga aurantia TaxID=2529383 RepID=UPI0012BCC8FD|nr:PorV/PorQ family protein [Fulvivirga aurantia]MTI23204.1 PorV/PorQ family protein [Fulvivirga aurantia]